MNTAIIDTYTLPTVLEGILSFQLPKNLPQESALQITLSTFNFSLDLKPLSIKPSTDNRTIKIVATIEKVVSLSVYLQGNTTPDGEKFEIIDASLGVEILKQTLQAEFIASSLRAALVLENEVRIRIPIIEFDNQLKISLPVNKISEMLKRRQMAYKLGV
ncbi:MAG: hypothetical protein HY819_15455 [Acidobacteria bacterium]|nr:hypothetical protein [Acidobacteriota bacterium]